MVFPAANEKDDFELSITKKMNNTSINASTRELLVAKTLNAPIEVVWEVWTNPDHIASVKLVFN